LAQQLQIRKFLSDSFVEFSIFSNGSHLGWRGGGIVGHISERGPPKDHSTKVWFKLAQWF
jgi:hypothetical protein